MLSGIIYAMQQCQILKSRAAPNLDKSCSQYSAYIIIEKSIHNKVTKDIHDKGLQIIYWTKFIQPFLSMECDKKSQSSATQSSNNIV